jgi:hypothetical protein
MAKHHIIIISRLGFGIDFPGFLWVIVNIELCACWYIASGEEGQTVYFFVCAIKDDRENPTVGIARVIHEACWCSEVQTVDIVHVFIVKPV